MRITNFLKEQTTDDVIDTESVDLGLYRGLTKPLESPTKLPIRTDRRPRDSSLYETVLFNIGFELTYGVADIRNRCIFAATDIDDAFPYTVNHDENTSGSVVEARPLKQAKVAWKPGIADSVAALDGLTPMYHNFGQKHEAALGLLDGIRDLIEHDGMINGRQILQQALAGIDYITDGDRAELTRLLTEQLKEAVGGYQVVSANSQPRIPEGVEVMIFDAPYYWAIPTGLEFEPYD